MPCKFCDTVSRNVGEYGRCSFVVWAILAVEIIHVYFW